MLNRVSVDTPKLLSSTFQKKAYALLFAVGFILTVLGLSLALPQVFSSLKTLYGIATIGMAFIGICLMSVAVHKLTQDEPKTEIPSTAIHISTPPTKSTPEEMREEFARRRKKLHEFINNGLTNTPEYRSNLAELNTMAKDFTPPPANLISKEMREEFDSRLKWHYEFVKDGLTHTRDYRRNLEELHTIAETYPQLQPELPFMGDPKGKFIELERSYYNALSISGSKDHPATQKAKLALQTFCKEFPDFQKFLSTF